MIRARKAAENAAAQDTAQARRELGEAIRDAQHATERLEGMVGLGVDTAQAFLAGVAARNAAGAAHSAAGHRVAFAQRRLAASIEGLAAAAQEAKSVEKLAERVAQATHKAGLAVAQRELDDMTVARFERAGNEATT